MKTSTVKGTNDYLPKEVLLRDYLQNTILETYINNGFEHIITPAIEAVSYTHLQKRLKHQMKSRKQKKFQKQQNNLYQE